MRTLFIWIRNIVLAQRYYNALVDIADIPIPPNDVGSKALQDWCYGVRSLVDKALCDRVISA